MNKTPTHYTDEQMAEIQEIINNNFTKDEEGYIMHEISSDYVHTDVQTGYINNKQRSFVTFGMGSREMNSPTNLKRCELAMYSSKKIDPSSQDGFNISSELVHLSKFPFKKDTWFGPGHTINATKEFTERFGFTSFAFSEPDVVANLTGIKDDIAFLPIVPIYDDEREWMMAHRTDLFLGALYERYGNAMFNVDSGRKHFIPDDDENELYAKMFMRKFNIDRKTLDKLGEYLTLLEEAGEEITEEMIYQWVELNK